MDHAQLRVAVEELKKKIGFVRSSACKGD